MNVHVGGKLSSWDKMVVTLDSTPMIPAGEFHDASIERTSLVIINCIIIV